MSNIDDKLNEVLNIAEEVLDKKEEKNPLEIANEPPKPLAPQNDDVDTDFETGRGELYKLLEKGNQAIEGILSLAKEGEHPRACLLYTSPSPRDLSTSRMPSSA